MITNPDITHLAKRVCPNSFRELIDAICLSDVCGQTQSFERLDEAVELTRDFVDKTLPYIWKEALAAAEVLPPLPLLSSTGSVCLTQRQCLCILTNSFFCTFANRPSHNCNGGPDLPSINFDELYGGHGWGSVEVTKLRMLLSYFEQISERVVGGDDLGRTISFTRREAKNSTQQIWEECDKPLLQPIMHDLGESIDDAKTMYRVDFANQIIGGGCDRIRMRPRRDYVLRVS